MAGTVAASTVITTVLKSETTSPPTIQNSAGTEVGRTCAAWACTGDGAILNGAFNVSSCSEPYAEGKTINFTNAMPNNFYAVVCNAGPGPDNNGPRYATIQSLTTTSVTASFSDDSSNNAVGNTYWAIFR